MGEKNMSIGYEGNNPLKLENIGFFSLQPYDREKREHIEDADPEWYYHENEALAYLFLTEDLFLSGVDGKPVVNCNDIFAWACADAEDIEIDYDNHIVADNEFWLLVNEMLVHGDRWGVIRWCIWHRGQKPQGPVADDMKKADEWDEIMESISENTMDAEVHALFAGARKAEIKKL